MSKISGKAASDIVLFSGNGTTGAINKLILSMELHLPHLEVEILDLHLSEIK